MTDSHADTRKASDLFIECLEAEGCEYIFGVPGEENLDFLDSLSRGQSQRGGHAVRTQLS